MALKKFESLTGSDYRAIEKVFFYEIQIFLAKIFFS